MRQPLSIANHFESGRNTSPLLRYGWLIYIALSVQILTFLMANQLDATATKVLIISSFIVLVPALLPNLKRPGIALILVGASLNFLVIVANGGRMPVDPTAYGVEIKGTEENANGYLPWSKGSFTRVDDARLWFLGDIFAVTYPIRLIYSAGDVLIFAGALVYIASLTGVFRYKYRRNHDK